MRSFACVATLPVLGAVLAAPMTAMPGPAPDPEAVPPPTAPASAPAAQAAPSQALDLTPPRIDTLPTPDEPQAVSKDESIDEQPEDAQSTPTIIVQGNASEATAPETTEVPCGLVGIAWAWNHPAETWRLFTPVPADLDLVACFNTSAGGDVASPPSH